MKATKARIISAALLALVGAATMTWMFGGDQHEGQSAQTTPTAPIRYDYTATVDRDGKQALAENPIGTRQAKEAEAKMVQLDVAAEAVAGGPVAGAVVTVRQIDGAGPNQLNSNPHDGRGVVQETRKQRGVIATGTTDANGRFKVKVPATATLSVEVAPPPDGRWINWDTPPLPPGFKCADPCVEVVLQDGDYQWRSNGNRGHYRKVSDLEKEYYEPLVFLFQCV